MAWYAAWERELLEQLAHTRGTLRDLRVDFAVRALQIRVGHHARAAMAGPADIEHVDVTRLDDAVEVGVNKVQSGRRSPVTEKPRFDVLRLEWLPQ